MGQQTFLLQQMLELTAALHRKPARETARMPCRADDPFSGPARQQLLRDIDARRRAGESFGCIAHALNQRGIRGEHGGRWYGATVRNFILRTQHPRGQGPANNDATTHPDHVE
jgi:hypothetical protein